MLRKFVDETLNTIRVTTYHPVGWGLGKLKNELRRVVAGEAELPAGLRAEPILFIHGIFHNSSAFYQLEKRARRLGFEHIASVELWTAFSKLEDMADELHTEVNRLRGLYGADSKIHLVTHSLGGMAARTALLREDFAAAIRQVIFLGTPHQGSALMGEIPFPSCVRDLSRNSTLLKRLKEEPLPPGIDYWNLRGDLDIVTPLRDTFLPNVPNINFEGIGHAGLLTNDDVVETVLAILQS